MSASIVSFIPARPPPSPARLGLPDQVVARQHLWRGASGRHYVHSVYSLIECPPLPKATYLLVRRDSGGWCKVLHVGVGANDAATLNLAQVRRRGAQLGANEVHVHFQQRSDAARSLVALDLRAGQFGELTAEPSRACA
jgi:hypothetical protein